jgi:hypothetical protein
VQKYGYVKAYSGSIEGSSVAVENYAGDFLPSWCISPEALGMGQLGSISKNVTTKRPLINYEASARTYLPNFYDAK